MKYLFVLFAFWAAAISGQQPRRDPFEDRAYQEFAEFFGVPVETAEDPSKLAHAIERLIGIGASSESAIARLKLLESAKAPSLQVKWEPRRSPSGMSVIYEKGGKGLSLQVCLVVDDRNRVSRAYVGEFAF